MEYQELTLLKNDGIALLTINNPKTLNAFSCNLLRELSAVFDELNADSSIVAIIVTGIGKSFVSGADITYMKDLTPDEAIIHSKDTTAIYDKMTASRKIMIAAINGFALGAGTEFALACDLRIAAENAKFGCPEVKLGIIPGGGGTQRLSRLIGTGRAKEMILTGNVIKADEALAFGLINKVVSEEELIKESYLMASKFLEVSPLAVGYAKECINKSNEIEITAGIEYEKNMFGLCFATQDQKEGMAAFVEKRKPTFNGPCSPRC